MKTVSKKLVYNGSLKIEEAIIHSENEIFKRERVKREDAVAVLILNTDTNKVILTRQFRYAIADKINEEIIEVVAGKIDPGEAPVETAISETEEETGYRVKKEHLRLLLSCFSSPGYSSELFYVFYATVTNADKVAKGGGLEAEHENITVVEMDLEKFTSLVRDAGIKDAKTYIAGLYMMLTWH